MDNKIKIVIEVDSANGIAQIKGIGAAAAQSMQQVTSASAGASSALGGLRESWLKVGAAAYAAYRVMQKVAEVGSVGTRYLRDIETAALGIGAAFMTGGKYIDAASGKALSAQRALHVAQVDSRKLIAELQYANLQTIATLDQLIVAYQQTLPVAIARGFNPKQIKEFTVAMVQAAGAIGLPMDQLAEETRSLLTGAINPRNSRIATVLGLRNEDIARYKSDAAGLFDFLMQKLDAYKTAGIAAQTTWAGLWSNTTDIAKQFLGQSLAPFFEAVKAELTALGAEIVTLDEKTQTIKWNPAFLEATQSIKLAITGTITEMYRLGMFADKAGGSLTRLLSWTPLALVPSWAEGLHKRNEEWLKRYDASSRALQDMAMREIGWKPMTPQMDAQIRQAVKEGIKIADQTFVNIGGDDGGTKQLLRYYKLDETAAAKWEQTLKGSADDTDAIAAAAEKAAKKADALRESWSKMSSTLSDENMLAGLSGARKAFEGNRLAADNLKREYADLPKALRLVAYAEIEKNQATKDAAVIDAAKLASSQEYQRSLKEDAAAVAAAAAAYNHLLASWDPMVERAQAVAASQKTIDDALARGVITTDAAGEAVRKLQQHYADLDAKALKDFLQEVEGIGHEPFAGNSFGNAQADNLGKAITALAEMNELYADQKKAVLDLAAARVAAEKMVASTIEQRKAKETALAAVTAKEHSLKIGQIEGQLSAYRTMFGAVGNLFKENSRERQAMHNIEMALAAVEIAMNAQKAISAAVVAVTTQGAGDPYTAFARIAAMMALMAGVLSQLGVSFGGGSAVVAPVLPASTVLGAAAGTGSESADKGWQLLEDTYKLEYRELTGIHASMKDLNKNITGLVTNIIRSGGKFDAAGFGVDTTFSPGFMEGFAPKLMPNYWMNTLSGGLYDKMTFGVSGWLDSLLGGLGGKIFGGGSEAFVDSSGLSVTGVGGGNIILGDLLAGSQLLVQSFADIRKETDSSWFRRGKTDRWTEYRALDGSITGMMSNVFKDMGEALLEINASLGDAANVAAIRGYQFEVGKIDLQGLDGSAINKKISETISSIGDTMVQDLLGGIVGSYQQINEGLLETATRLTIDKAVILDTLAMTNQAFVGTTAEAVAFSEAIIAMAGDLDKLRTSAETYHDKFFSAAEKQARLQEQLTGALAKMGLVLPGVRDGYRLLIENLNLSTEAGQRGYVTLLRLADAADTYYSALDDAAKKQLDLAEGLRAQSQTTADWLSAMNRSTLAPVQSAEAWQVEYARLKAAATAENHTAQDTSGFLSYAREYLEFQKAYGNDGSYQQAYAQVAGDVQGIGDVLDAQAQAIDQQMAAAKALSLAAATLNIAGVNLINAATTQGAEPPVATGYYMENWWGWGNSTEYYRQPGMTDAEFAEIIQILGLTKKAAGGYANTPSIFGEAGGEWAVPTYEPERSRFLASAPPAFWNNLSTTGRTYTDLPAPSYDLPQSSSRSGAAAADAIGKSIAAQIRPLLAALAAGSIGGDKEIHVHLHIDGREVATSVADQYDRGNARLILSTRKRVQ